MSAVQQMMFAGRAPITVSGTVYGSGSIAIPAGVTSVSLTGQGGSGTYSAGQGSASYPSGLPPYVAEQTAVAGTVSGSATCAAQFNYNALNAPQYIYVSVSGSKNADDYSYTVTYSGYPDTIGSGLAFQGPYGSNYFVPGYQPQFFYSGGYPYSGYLSVTTTPGSPYVAAVGSATYPSGLPAYIAPSYTTGQSTTATLNGTTNTWAGGYGGAGTPSSQPLTSNGTGQTLTYSVGSGGYITYSYTY